MTRGQYIAMCLIGAVAVIAYLQSYRAGIALQKITGTASILKPGTVTL